MHSLDESMYSVESTCSRPLRALCLAKAVDLALYRPSLSARIAAGYVHLGLVFGHCLGTCGPRPRLVEADDTVYAQAFARGKILVRLSAPVLGIIRSV